MKTTSKITPCIWFDDQAEQAAEFYVRTLPAGRSVATSYYPASSENPGGRPPGSVLTAEFEIAGQRFTALNGGPLFVLNPSISFFVQVASPAEVDGLFAPLTEGGKVLMPLQAYPWSERFAWVMDRFGVTWQLIAGPRAEGSATIVPCLMFAEAQSGRAEEAMRFYTGTFPEGRLGRIERYAAGEGPEGAVKHGRFNLAGQELVAMDSHLAHGFTFNEALSLQVMCDDQVELDHYWESLASGGQPGPCGWLKDRFGLSWQVVPRAMDQWMASTDTAARDRAFGAMLKMQKLDIAVLEQAYEGT